MAQSPIPTLIDEMRLKQDKVDMMGYLDLCRSEISRRLNSERRSTLGQFLTPSNVARFMASMLIAEPGSKVSLLDPGAGIGSLFAASVEAMCSSEKPPMKIKVTAYEIEPLFLNCLQDTANICSSLCKAKGVEFEANIVQEDFIAVSVLSLRDDLFSQKCEEFTHVIMNPPYHKIQTQSKVRKLLSTRGIETSNIYAAFMSVASDLLADNGQMVSITPRSFCNGLYFKPFRKRFLNVMNIERLHIFHSRSQTFREDDVLQENIIMSSIKDSAPSSRVLISSSDGIDDEGLSVRQVDRKEVVDPRDDDAFIHIITDELESEIEKLGTRLDSSLDELGLQVSTGRVVDFRADKYIVQNPVPGSVPLIYPAHFSHGYVRWPSENGKKPNAILSSPQVEDQLVPSEHYVVIKRFSSKEERKRIVAAIYDAGRIDSAVVGFENHLNYFHKNNKGLDLDLAKGLAAFLNSTFVDTLFRHFSGHTQVNAVDLRRLRYPNLRKLEKLGKNIGVEFPTQDELDRMIEKELLNMPESESTSNPLAAKDKIEEALSILKMLGFPRAQLNERSALTLLALLDLKPTSRWEQATSPLCGITPMMEFFAQNYRKTYKPNTRETVRRQTVHQFLDAGIIVENPDEPERPTNSPKAVYQIERDALSLLKTFGLSEWEIRLRTYLANRQTLAQKYAREREMKRIPLEIGKGKTITLSPGGQNVLVKQIIDEFAPRFTPGCQLAYVGDTDEKFAYWDKKLLAKLGIEIEEHGKMPDVMIYHQEKNWLVLIEAVTSHGPMNPKRRAELKNLFAESSAGLVFVTAFLTRKAMVEYLSDISWETEVWVAESPSHLIHFNGERFLGPYES